MKKLVVVVALIMALSVYAARALNQPSVLIQPDGTKINVNLTGDEFYVNAQDENGYTIVKGENNWYYYGVRQGEEVVPSNLKAGISAPSNTMEKGVWPSKESIQRKRDAVRGKSSVRATSDIKRGKYNNLVIFVKLSDSNFADKRGVYESRYNGEESSLGNYYYEASMGQFNMENHMFPKCNDDEKKAYNTSYSRSQLMSYDWNHSFEMNFIRTALKAYESEIVASGVNFDMNNDGAIDNVSLIISGGSYYGASALWPHKWDNWGDTGYQINTATGYKHIKLWNWHPVDRADVATMAHEFFHTLGAPDLYRGGSSHSNIDAVENWDPMDGYPGAIPMHMLQWQKYYEMEWVDPVQLGGNGKYTINPNTVKDNSLYYKKLNSSEYLLLEYRRKKGDYDKYSYGSGLIVYRANTSKYYKGNYDSYGPSSDYLYVFRPNGTNNTAGSLSQSFLSAEAGRTRVDDASNFNTFYSGGSKAGLTIDGVGMPGEENISFYIGDAPQVDPEVKITSPEDGIKIVQGEYVFIEANAVDPGGAIISVKFYINGDRISTDTSMPYKSSVWRTGNYDLGTYEVKVVAEDNSGLKAEDIIEVEIVDEVGINEGNFNTELYKAYPNPFNPSTNLTFTLDKSVKATLNIYNANGEFVETLVDRNLGKGLHKFTFDGKNKQSGVYYYQLNADGKTLRNKMVLIK